MSEYDRLIEYSQVLRFGHLYTALTEPGRAKPGSHDDGPASGMFLGGIGAPVCSRDLNGSFSRWHMQSGLHVRQEISSGFVSLRWASSSDSGCMRLNEQGAQENGFTREVRSLFPVVQERYIGISHEFDILLEWYSAIYPEAYLESSLPLFYLTIGIENRGEERIDFDSACFFPNLLGWKQQQMTSTDRSAACWPSQTHAGNTRRHILPMGSAVSS